jgi:two-component system phosphate regulon sensor histidine kinase PhoR
MLVKKSALFIPGAALALLGLLLVQGYWFWRAFSLEERAFDEKVHLALRAVAHRVLQQSGDATTPLGRVAQPAANQYELALQAPVSYVNVHQLVLTELTGRDVFLPYELALFTPHSPDQPVLGGSVDPAAGPAQNLPCVGRAVEPALYRVRVRFPGKGLHLAESLQVWYFSTFAFLLVALVFGYTLVLIRKERQMAAARRDFLNNMTHELKTPLASIALASEVLQQPASLQSERKMVYYASLIYKESKRLEAQIARVLEMARLERSELHLELETLDVHQLIEEVSRTETLQVERRKGRLHYELQANQRQVQGDGHHLKNVLHNLLENARKYSPQAPFITIATRNVGDQLVISVQDQGRGMGPEKELIFAPFYRVATGNRHDTKGFGLGLSYVKRVVEAHQGRIEVASRPNQGSRFDVFLRCA